MSVSYKCLECFATGKKHMIKADRRSRVSDFKSKFSEYDNARSKTWASVQTAARDFVELLVDINTAGFHPEDFFSPDNVCEVLTSLLSAGIQKRKHVSDVLSTAYHCVRFSRKYHRELYNARRFWCILFEHLLGFPDPQFFEGIMVFFFVVAPAFTEKFKCLSCSSYNIVIDEYLYLTGAFQPEKFFLIFKRLYELDEKQITSRDTAFSLDYRKVVSPLFAPAVAEKEWYSLKENRPVDFMALIIHLSLTRPVILDLLLVNEPGIPMLMDILRNESCKRMHAPIIFSVDTMLSIDSSDSRYGLLHKLLKQLDYSLILKFAVYDSISYVRTLAQRVIIHTLRFLDAARKSGFCFGRPHKFDLLNVEYGKLKNMISKGGLDDKVFAFVIITERTESERENVTKEKFQDYAVCILNAWCEDRFIGPERETNDELISCVMNFLVSVGPLDEKQYPSLAKSYTVKCLSKFYNYDVKDIKLLSRVNTVNICQTSFSKKLELFRLVPMEVWVDEIYDLYERDKRGEIKKILYSQMMPVTVKLIHYNLCIMYHVKKSRVLEQLQHDQMSFLKTLKTDESGNMCLYVNGENWSDRVEYVQTDRIGQSSVLIEVELADKMMEVLVATVFDKSMPERYNTIAVACIAHLMHDEGVDVSKHISDRLVSEAMGMYDDAINRYYLSDGGDFKAALTNKPAGSKLTVKGGTREERKEAKKRNKREAKASKAMGREVFLSIDKSTKEKYDRIAREKGKSKSNDSPLPSEPPASSSSSVNKSTKVKNTKQQQASTKPDPKPNKDAEASNGKPMEPKKIKKCALPSCGRVKPSAHEGDSDARQRFKKCGRCRAVTYCGRECQTKHWVEHKLSCEQI